MTKWKVSSNYINGKRYFRAYRLIDENEVDHSGNREYAGKYMENREDAQIFADCLNRDDTPIQMITKNLFGIQYDGSYIFVAADSRETALYAAIKGVVGYDIEKIQFMGQVHVIFEENESPTVIKK